MKAVFSDFESPFAHFSLYLWLKKIIRLITKTEIGNRKIDTFLSTKQYSSK